MKTHLLILLFILTGFSIGKAQEDTDSVRIHFRVSQTELDPDFQGNRQALDSIFRKLSADTMKYYGPTHKLSHVKVIGSASPEGSVELNKKLSQKRAESIFKEFRKRGFLNNVAPSFTYKGRDWNGLLREVESDPNVPDREDVLTLLSSIVSDNPPAHPLTALKKLNGGVPYNYLLEYLFPALRESSLVAEYERLYPKLRIPRIALSQPDIDIEVSEEILPITYTPTIMTKQSHPFYMALKTNMLLDALLIPNIGAEFYVGKNWSVTADWMYGWWDRDRSHYYWRAYGGSLGARRWFGRKAHEKPLTGHHLGMFAGVVTYDFELGKGGIMGGLPKGTLWDRCNFISGIEYGYSLPVARRLNIDFSLAVGYMGGKYLKYEPKYGFYMWQSTHKLRWIGPTKAEISLVWLIGSDNYNKRKGGDR